MRVLHLIDGGFRGLGEPVDMEPLVLACRLLTERAGHGQSVCVVGPRSAAGRAAELGLRVDASIAPVLGLPESAWWGLRRYVSAAGRPGVVQCWGARAGRLALRAFGDGVPRITVVREGEAAPEGPALTLGGSVRDGVEALPPPVIDVDGSSRERVRSGLGAGPDDVLVLLVGSGPHADAMRFTFLNGLLVKSGVRMTGVTTSGVAQRGRGVRFQRGREWVTIIRTRRPLLAVLPACDVAVFDGGGPSPTADWPECPGAGEQAVAQAHAAGVPVVAPRWATGDDAYPEEAAAVCRGVNGTLPELARRVTALVCDASLRGRLSRAVLEHSRRRDAGSAFVGAVQAAWERCVPEAAHA